MTLDRDIFKNRQNVKPFPVQMGDSSTVMAQAGRKVKLSVTANGCNKDFIFCNVFHVLDLHHPPISTGALVSNNVTVAFDLNGAKIIKMGQSWP